MTTKETKIRQAIIDALNEGLCGDATDFRVRVVHVAKIKGVSTKQVKEVLNQLVDEDIAETHYFMQNGQARCNYNKYTGIHHGAGVRRG